MLGSNFVILPVKIRRYPYFRGKTVKYFLILCVLFVLLCVDNASAQTPRIISVQGILEGDPTKPVNGSFNLTLRLYTAPTGGTLVFQESVNTEVQKGLFNVYLGSTVSGGIPLDMDFDRPYWLGVSMGSDEFTPRIQLAAAPYALAIADSSVTPAKISRRSAQSENQAMVTTKNGVEWKSVVTKISGEGPILVEPYGGTGDVTVRLSTNAITREYIAPGTLTYEQFSAKGAPKDGDVLTYIGVPPAGRLQWKTPTAVPFVLPYSGEGDVSGQPALTITNVNNGSSAKFAVNFAANNSPALIAENNGLGAAFAANATGTGIAATFNVSNINSSAPAIKAEAAGSGYAIEGNAVSATAKSNGIIGRVASTADSIAGVTGIATATLPGASASGVSGAINSTGARGFGVWGRHAGRGVGVMGSTLQGIGVKGLSRDSIGILGIHSSATGIFPGIYGASASIGDTAAGIVGEIVSKTGGINSAGIKGIHNDTLTNGAGVWGLHNGHGTGVMGSAAAGVGVRGFSRDSMGIAGYHTGASGRFAGVYGETVASAQDASGVQGVVRNTVPGIGSAGVRGINNGLYSNGSGVYGSHTGKGYGVYGISSEGTGVAGFAQGEETASGVQGTAAGASGIGVSAQATSSSGRNYGVWATSASDSGVAIYGSNTQTAASSYAGYFQGKVNITGDITRTYANVPNGERRAMPIGYATIAANGAITAGTPNIACNWDGSLGAYLITIQNENFTETAYTCAVTPINANTPLIPVTSTASNSRLMVKLFNLGSATVQSGFQVIIFKP